MAPSKFIAAALTSAVLWTHASASDTPQLHPIEAACVDYEMSGQMQSGTTTRCHRNYAYEQYEIQNLTMGIAGFTQSTNQHVITIGDTIYSIDLSTNVGTQTENPMYQQLVDAMDGADPQEMSDAFITGMGFTPNGATKTIAGYECSVYTSQMMGTACLTTDGLMLEQSFMGNTQLATSVEIGTGGADENYTLYENVTINDGPDINAIMQMMNSGQ